MKFRAVTMTRYALATFMSLLGSASIATDKSELVTALIKNGSHEYFNSRHRVEIDDCTMTLEHWMDRATMGPVLWTSNTFQMQDVIFRKPANQSTGDFLHILPEKGSEDPEVAVVVFLMRSGTYSNQERSNALGASPESKPSPRNDGTTHHVSKSKNFVLALQGPGTGEKARIFTAAFRAYVDNHCKFTS
ncbi:MULTISPECIES: hypothetical protein [Roseovarius]|uniref:hypothetical protein n=1 Tax=Roseovarius TaxID=74030 RepID=UPI00273E18F3|nr:MULTISPECIES: hypothetical protein [unclassified Roseovarius]